LQYLLPLEIGNYYHIYNRGVGKQLIFRNSENYQYFLQKAKKYLHPIAEIFTYCLIPNHFHFFIKIKTIEEQNQHHFRNNLKGDFRELDASKQFSHFFNAYAQAFNKSFERKGSLFERPFKRIKVENDEYITRLIYYIHSNPIKHRITNNFYNYSYSSYSQIIEGMNDIVNSDFVIDWFSGEKEFELFHKEIHNLRIIEKYYLED